MCLAVPGKIVKIVKDKATVDYGSEQRVVSLLDDGYAVGEYVLVQGGFAIDRIPQNEAEESLMLYQQALSGSCTPRSSR